ncbi:MAG: serine/threonine-protein kinase [Candidatus Brocadiia bacterium]
MHSPTEILKRLKGYSDPQYIYYTPAAACLRAVHQETYQTHVIKVFAWDTIEDKKAELEAAKRLPQIQHPNLMKVLSIKEDHELGIYYIMEDWGESLTEITKRVPPHPYWTISKIKDISHGLAELHRNKIVHFDIKPDNIFIKDNNVKLGDYGLAGTVRLNTVSSPLGASLYMAPEIFSGNDIKRDYRHDIYSMGAVLYTLLTQTRPPLTANNLKPPKDLPIADDLWQVVCRALDSNPDKRYQTAEEFLGALENIKTDRVTCLINSEKLVQISAISPAEIIPPKSEPAKVKPTATPKQSEPEKSKQYNDELEKMHLSLDNAEKTLGKNHQKLVPHLNSMASLYLRKGDLATAENLFNRALQIMRTTYGKDSYMLVEILNEIAIIYEAGIGEFIKAEALYKEALSLTEKHFKPKSVQASNQRSYLGGLYYSKKDYAQAISYYQDALKIRKDVLGDNDIALGPIMKYIVDIYLEMHKYDEAEATCKQALNIIEKNKLGEKHPQYLILLRVLIEIYKKCSKPNQAKSTEIELNRILGTKSA